MKKIHFYMVVHAVILAVAALPVMYAAHKQHEQATHECKQQIVEVTKTEGDLTWTEPEAMEVCN
jgi:hypothetical protein